MEDINASAAASCEAVEIAVNQDHVEEK